MSWVLIRANLALEDTELSELVLDAPSVQEIRRSEVFSWRCDDR